MLLQYYKNFPESGFSGQTFPPPASLSRFQRLLGETGERARQDLYLTIAGANRAREETVLWNSLTKTDEYCSAIIALLPHNPGCFDALLKSLQTVQTSGEPEDRQRIIEETVRKLKALKPALGLSAAEVGGTICHRILSPLGASVYFADAGYLSDRLLLPANRIKNPESLITLKNYQTVFPEQVDISTSRMVFLSCSGIEALPEGAGNVDIAFQYGSLELLAVFANITKTGGLSLHHGVCEHFASWAAGFGFRVIKRFEYAYEPYRSSVLLEKQHPVESRNIRCGGKTIALNRASGLYELTS